jgi:predicted Zn-dependent peptidase
METVRLDRDIFQTTAPTGVIVLSERVPSVRSAAVGIWVRSASVHEPRPKMGVSHLLEHMVFKGTERRSAQEIALALESRGGSLDAYTSRDTTSFQARVLDTDLPRALDVLTDLVRHPVLRNNDLELERNVVLEEINTVEDTPDDRVFDLCYQTLWPEHPYGYTILGTRDSVSALSTGDLKQLHQRAYFPANCVIAAAGNLTHEHLLDELGKQGWLDAAPGSAVSGSAVSGSAISGNAVSGNAVSRNASPGNASSPTNASSPPPVPPAVRGTEARHMKDTAQTHIVFATDTIRYADARKYALLVLGNVFGGGMSSRLFQRIREELGLAYAIYAFTSFYREMGVAGVYVGTQPKTASQAAAAIREEYAKLAREGLVGDALAEAKQQTQGQLMLSLESPSARMYRLASFPVYGEKYRGLDEVIAAVAGLTEDAIGGVAAEFFAPERQTVVWLGPDRG